MTTYSEGFKARLVQRLLGAERISATALSRDVGIAQPTLSRWVREARRLARMKPSNPPPPTPPKSPRQWTVDEKFQVVLEAATLTDEALGAFLRRRGLHEAQLTEWRARVTQGAKEALRGPQKKTAQHRAEAQRIQQLERELHRKEKALAEVAALLTLKKKVNEIWGDGDDDTTTKSGT